MHSKISIIALFAAITSAQQTPNLTAALASSPDLSSLAGYVSSIPSLITSLASAQNITILAPSNEAFAKLNASGAAAALTAPGALEAALRYHVLNGTYPASAITDTPTFVPTLLQDPRFTNVTGGQAVEAVKQGDKVLFYSGLLSNATVSKAVRAASNRSQGLVN